jgi:CBS domain-containing protein
MPEHKLKALLDHAAGAMRQSDIGDVLVDHDGQLCGLVIDRDIVVRAVAEGADPTTTSLGDICSHTLIALDPDDTVVQAVQLLRDNAVRRLPVVEGGKAIGIVTLGDLAMQRDPDSALADISEAPPTD